VALPTILHQYNGAADIKKLHEILKTMQDLSVSSPIGATGFLQQYIRAAIAMSLAPINCLHITCYLHQYYWCKHMIKNRIGF
jgi:hypothetical protein